MSLRRVSLYICSYLLVGVAAFGASLSCVQPGTERWPVKTSLPPGATTQTMTLADALNLQKLTGVARDDPRYQNTRIMDQPVKEDTLVTISGWLYLVGFESDDCDFHIQISPQPRTSTDKPT
ncbi:MAG: hypothetical protein ABSH56_18385, partial [Bryobacteraceae bacterium]